MLLDYGDVQRGHEGEGAAVGGAGADDDEAAGFGDGGEDVGDAAVQVVGGIEGGLIPLLNFEPGGLQDGGEIQAIEKRGIGDADAAALVQLDTLDDSGRGLRLGDIVELEFGFGGCPDERLHEVATTATRRTIDSSITGGGGMDAGVSDRPNAFRTLSITSEF